MKKGKNIANYFIWIPFAVSIGAYALYLRYFLTIKFAPNVAITKAVNAIMNRYFNIGTFCLIIGLILLFASKISRIIFKNDKYYHENYPWTKKVKKERISVKENEDKFINPEIEEDTTISENEDNIVINEETSYDENIAKDIKRNRVLKARFIDSEDERTIEILDDDKNEKEILSLNDAVVIPSAKKQTVIRVDSSKVTIDGFVHCPKCNNLVVEDAVICVHCGILLDESLRNISLNNKTNESNEEIKKEEKVYKTYKPLISTKFIINAIIIIICFMGIILLCNKIGTQKTINEKNVNTKTNIKIGNLR